MPRMRISLLLLLTACTAWAKEPSEPSVQKSHFGYELAFSNDWTVVSPESIAQRSEKETAASLGLGDVADQGNLRAILESVKGGKVEFYFYKNPDGPSAGSNISAQLQPYAGELTEEAVSEGCKEIPSGLPAVYGSPIEEFSCGLESENGVNYIAYEYRIPAGARISSSTSFRSLGKTPW